ncbi:MAG: NAD(P)/FAD-dependent oxidoreductase [Hyphomonadaceae bacterium]
MLDVAIIGGGIAGCYCADRLVTQGGSVALFEASGRIGGRLWSAPLAGGGLAEIGGMFFRDNHRSVRALVRRLGLAFEPVEFRRDGQFARGQFFSDSEFRSPTLPFALADAERKNGPAALLAHALDKIASGAADQWPINREPPRCAQATFAFLRRVRHQGRPLHEYALWNVLSDVISAEAYAILASSLGSASLIRTVNAFDGVWNLLHELGDGQGFRLVAGYQRLPVELAQRAETAGAKIHLNRRLTAITRRNSHFELSVAGQSPAPVQIRAKQVILALPQRSLQLITFDPALFDNVEAFAHLRDNAVRPMRSSKTFLAYDQAWWSASDEAPTRIAAQFTDLPMQQCYYFGRAAFDEPAVLMAAYADDVSASFWPSLASGGTKFPSCADSGDDAQSLQTSQALVQCLQEQLSKLNRRDSVPAPFGALHFDWSGDPYGGAWHAWTPHFKSWDIRPRMRQPNPSLDLFICGEAYAQRNGWVEGAINSAELALERLGLSRPGWITDPDFQFEVDDRGVRENDHSNDGNVQRLVHRHGSAA